MILEHNISINLSGILNHKYPNLRGYGCDKLILGIDRKTIPLINLGWYKIATATISIHREFYSGICNNTNKIYPGLIRDIMQTYKTLSIDMELSFINERIDTNILSELCKLRMHLHAVPFHMIGVKLGSHEFIENYAEQKISRLTNVLDML